MATDQPVPWPGGRPTLIGGMSSIDTVVSEWIALAREELAAGSAGRALFLGRELHWVDADEWRKECTELLVGAYQKLDRGALADIVKIHHQHRDLTSVGVCETPEPTAFAVAERAGDLEAIRAYLAKHVPSAAELADALRTTNLTRALRLCRRRRSS